MWVVRGKAAVPVDKKVFQGKWLNESRVKCEPFLILQGKPSRPVSVQWVSAAVWGTGLPNLQLCPIWERTSQEESQGVIFCWL